VEKVHAVTRVLAVAVTALVLSTGATATTAFGPSPGHRLAGFALDREWLALAEDPVGASGCPLVRLFDTRGGGARTLTRPGGPTCRLGGRFSIRRGRAVGVAIVRAIWVVENGTKSIVVKASPTESESVLGRAPAGELGPVVATNWLRLYALNTPAGGSVVSANRRTLWTTQASVTSIGLDDAEHAVSVGEDGSIAMWHPHGARYGVVAAARALAAATDGDLVAVLRSDRPRLDVRRLSGRLVSSWPVVRGAASLLDAEGGVAVYIAGRDVHELTLASGRDRVVARAPAGTTLLDAQIERRLVAYAIRGGSAGPGRVIVSRR
jgi:hypothetical protein